MNILEELNDIFSDIGIPLETGIFLDTAPDEYIVIVPLSDTYGFHADDKPNADVQGARISIYSKGNYMSAKKKVVNKLLEEDFTITDRKYITYETDTGYHHYAVDVEKNYEP